jgi:hypothetical protein
MFNVSVRKIVVSAICITAPVAFSFGASSEAWGGKTTQWEKGTSTHAKKTTQWEKTTPQAGRTTQWEKISSKTTQWE